MRRVDDMLVLLMLTSAFVTSIVFANIAAGIKVFNFLGLIATAGTIAYAFTFPITDVVEELYGKKVAQYVVWSGLVAEILMLIQISIAYALPPLTPEMQEMYVKVFGLQTRIVTGSLLAYLVSQHFDVWVFWKVREITRGRHLWLRNNVGEFLAQLLDTAIFTTVAFVGVFPLDVLTNMIITMWVLKIIIAAADTPFVYLTLSLCRRVILQWSQPLTLQSPSAEVVK